LKKPVGAVLIAARNTPSEGMNYLLGIEANAIYAEKKKISLKREIFSILNK